LAVTRRHRIGFIAAVFAATPYGNFERASIGSGHGPHFSKQNIKGAPVAEGSP